MGLFALGAVSAHAAELDPFNIGDTLEGTNHVTYSSTDEQGTSTGSISVTVPTTQTIYYTYTKPNEYELKDQTSDRMNNTVTTDGVYHKVFKGINSTSVGGVIYNTKDLSTVGIVADFVNNSVSGDRGLGGAIYNKDGSIGSIVGDFVSNRGVGSQYTGSGAAIFNSASYDKVSSVGSIVGDFVGNYATGRNGVDGGTISNTSDGVANLSSITGNFLGNNAYSSQYALYGGVIKNSANYSNQGGVQATIGSIVGNFIGNYATSTKSIYGGIIHNLGQKGGCAEISSITGSFIGNYGRSTGYGSYTVFGGVILNEAGSSGGEAIISSITGDFIGNYALASYSYGGAIFNGGTLYSSNTYTPQLNLNAKITLAGNTFTGNKMNGKPNSIYNYGTINIADNATVTINDGWQSHTQGKLVMGTGSTLNMNIGNGTPQNDSLGKITNVGTINATVDVDLTDISAPGSDTITVSSVTQAGFINLTSLKLKGDFDTYKNHEFTQRLLINSDVTSDLRLKLALNKIIIDDTEYYVLEQGEKKAQSDMYEDTDGTAKWSDIYGSYNLSTDTYGEIALASSNDENIGTTEDSITFKVIGKQENKSDITLEGDTLKIVNQSDKETRNFNATTESHAYVVSDTEGLGKAGAGVININGKPDGASANGTIDLNGKTGFELDKATTLNLNNVTITNASGDVIDAGATAVVNLNNAEIDGSMTNAGVINSSNAVLGGNVVGMGDSVTLNITGDTEMTGVVTNHQVNVSNATLTVGAGNLVSSDNLTAKDGSEIEIGSNKVNLDQVKFESGSKLNLKINSLSDFGGIEANNITVAASGAELSATLAQGINAGTVQLLKANNTDFNNFVDSFDNEMYVFEKADKNGLYNIKLAKTAEEVAEEAGGTTTEARAAAAWVDGNQFDEGTKAAEVANALADLAQNEPKEFTKALSVVAPQEAPKAQSELTELSDKLLLTVGKYLSNQDIGGLSSGDALQDVTIWAKGYYGESKLSNHGKVKGFDSKNKGVIAGFDKKLNKAVKVGAGFQYNDSDVDAYHRDVEVDSLVGFVYGEYRPSKWFVSGVASFGKADYDEEKHALGIKIKDNYSANVYSLQALTGYDFKYVTPEIGARYYRIKRHGYTDNIGQSVSGKDMDLMRGVFGLRSSYEFGMFKPEVYAGITYDFVSDEDNALVSLPNGSSYTVDGRRLKRFGTEFSANVTAQITDNTKIGAGYEGKFREHYQDHTGMISVKYEF